MLIAISGCLFGHQVRFDKGHKSSVLSSSVETLK